MTTAFCPSCGYNLFGIPEVRCPECGFHYDYAGITALAEDESLRSYWAKLVSTRAAFALAFAAPALANLVPWSPVARYVTVFSLLVGAVVLRQCLIGATPYGFWESFPVAWLCAVALASLAGILLLLSPVGTLFATAMLADGWRLFFSRLVMQSYSTLSLPGQLQHHLTILTRWAGAGLMMATIATAAVWYC